MNEAVVSLELTLGGIKRITILADTAEEQGSAHLILSAVSAEIAALDGALKSLSSEPVAKQ